MRFSVLMLLTILICGSAYGQSQFLLQPGNSDVALPAALIGTWGSAEQCAAHRAGDIRNPALFPYEIAGTWIRQGSIYCFLLVQNNQASDGDILVYASARCGEDDIRDYQLSLKLNADSLQIRWSSDFTTRPLEACR